MSENVLYDKYIKFSYIKNLLDNSVDINNVKDKESDSFESLVDKISSINILPGSIVLIRMPNGKKLLECFFACLLNGIVPALVSPATTMERVDEIGKVFGAKAVLSNRILVNTKNTIRNLTCGIEFLEFDNEIKKYSSGDVVILTSGTSGALSGCLHSINSLLKNAEMHIEAVELNKNHTLIITLPMYFSYALVAQALAVLIQGCRLIISGPPFNLTFFIESIDKFDVTFSSITPYILRAMNKIDYKLPNCLNTITIGGDHVERQFTERLLSNNSNKKIYLTYGLTEAGPRVATLAAHLEQGERLSSVGKPLNGVIVSLKKDNPTDKFGELLVTSDTILKQKIGIVDGSVRPSIYGRNTISTGDIFKIDDNGYLYFIRRKSEFIITRGEKVCLNSVKRIVNLLPDVIKTIPRIYKDSNGDIFDLDVYVHADALAHEKEHEGLRKMICKQLLMTERPKNINIFSIDESKSYK